MQNFVEFLYSYFVTSEDGKNLICKCYMHVFVLMKDTYNFPNLYMGDVELCTFISILANQSKWRYDLILVRQRET